MTIIFATGNKDKMTEIRRIMEPLHAEILSMKEAGVDIDVVENGDTFEANALIKATGVANMLRWQKDYQDAIVLADDSGLEIDALGGEPGIYSARYMGHDTPYPEKNRRILERVQDVPEEKRTARFVCAIAAVLPDGQTLVSRKTMEGHVAHEIAGNGGFGYDPIFFLPEYGKTSAELTADEKNAISHRGKALTEMMEKLKSYC